MSSPFCRILFSILLASSTLPAPLSADTAPPEKPAADDDAFFEEWLRGDDLLELDQPGDPTGLSVWEGEAKFSTGVGYRDNVMLSASDPKGGGFLLGGFDAAAVRLSERFNLSLFLTIERLEFDRNLPSDTFANFYSMGTFPIQNDKSVNIATRAFWMDQVVEVATLTGADERMRVRSSGVDLIPSLRKDWVNNTFSEAFLLVSRMISQEKEVSDYWEAGPRISAGWSPRKSELSLSFTYLERHFDDRRAFNHQGEPMENTEVKFRRFDSGANFRHRWGERSQWHSNSWLGIEINRDNETDYFSYDRIRAAQQIGYEVKDWDFEASIRYSHYSYEVQRTSADGPLRRRQLWGGGLEARRSLTSQLDLFGRYDWDTADSNDPTDSYDVNTWTVGLGWQF